MDSYIQFPRYSIYLIPNKLFIEQVEKLLLKNNIKFNNSKIIDCDYIICNSDPPNVYQNLIKSKNNYNFLFKQKMKRMDYSMGLFVYYFGSKRQYKEVRFFLYIML